MYFNVTKPCYIKLFEIKTCNKSKPEEQNQTPQQDTLDEGLGSIIVNENHGYKIVGLDNKSNFDTSILLLKS